MVNMLNVEGFKLVLWEDIRVDDCQINHRCIQYYTYTKVISPTGVVHDSRYKGMLKMLLCNKDDVRTQTATDYFGDMMVSLNWT